MRGPGEWGGGRRRVLWLLEAQASQIELALQLHLILSIQPRKGQIALPLKTNQQPAFFYENLGFEKMAQFGRGGVGRGGQNTAEAKRNSSEMESCLRGLALGRGQLSCLVGGQGQVRAGARGKGDKKRG